MRTTTIYLLGPLVLLAAFAGYFFPADARLEAALRDRREAAAQAAAREEAERLAREATARKEHEARVAQRRQDEAARAARKLAAEAAREAALREALAAAQTERDTLRTAVADAAVHRDQLARRREQADAEVFHVRRELEARRIIRRSLDLELQRLAGMLADVVAPTVWSELPLFPTPQRASSITSPSS